MRGAFTRLFRAGSAGLLSALCGVAASPTAAQDIWREPVQIQRQPTKPGRKPAPRQAARRVATVQRAALLTLQWRLLKFTEDGLRRVVNVNDTFSPQDRLVLAVKANQSGYLYVVRQPSSGGDGRLLFPARNYNGGRNYVPKDYEFVLPSDCSDFTVPCWLSLPPSAGKEALTLIFSRDQIDELPNTVAAGGVQTVGAQRLAALVAASEQKLQRIPGVLSDRFTVWVRNTNAANNEEIIETLTLNNAGSVKAAGAASGQ